MSLGEWISPNGDIEPVSSFVYNHHEDTVIENPEKYGLTKKDLESFKKADSTVDIGDIRLELMEKVLKNGWIRVRKYEGRGAYYGVTVWHMTPKKRKNIEKWAQHVLSEEEDKFIPVKIVDLNTEKNASTTELQDVANGYLDETCKTTLEEILGE